jgi:hypothetical protein
MMVNNEFEMIRKEAVVYYRGICRDSAVGIATGYELDDQGIGVRVPVGANIFSSSRLPDLL